MNFRTSLAAALIALLCTTACTAQQSEEEARQAQAVTSDRPIIIRVQDLENHSQQIELDLLVSRSRDGTPTKVRFPVLYRVDTGPDTELRLQTDFVTIQNPNLGFGDISLGAKYQIGPNTALIGVVELPTGSPVFADPGVEPTLLVAQDIPLSERWSLGLNAGLTFNQDAATENYYAQFNGAVQVGYALTGTTDLNAAVILKTPDALEGGIIRTSGAVGIGHNLDVHNRLNLTLGRSFSATGDDFFVLFGWAHKI